MATAAGDADAGWDARLAQLVPAILAGKLNLADYAPAPSGIPAGSTYFGGFAKMGTVAVPAGAGVLDNKMLVALRDVASTSSSTFKVWATDAPSPAAGSAQASYLNVDVSDPRLRLGCESVTIRAQSTETKAITFAKPFPEGAAAVNAAVFLGSVSMDGDPSFSISAQDISRTGLTISVTNKSGASAALLVSYAAHLSADPTVQSGVLKPAARPQPANAVAPATPVKTVVSPAFARGFTTAPPDVLLVGLSGLSGSLTAAVATTLVASAPTTRGFSCTFQTETESAHAGVQASYLALYS